MQRPLRPLRRPPEAAPATVRRPPDPHQGYAGRGFAEPDAEPHRPAQGQHARLKQFAGFEIAEQETVANILKAIQTGAAPNGAIPSPSDAEVMQNLDDAGKSAVEKFRQMNAGWAFDREYLRAEIDGHNRLLEIQQAYLRAPDNLDETNVAKLAQGMIKEHLTLLGDMQAVGGEHAERMRGHMRMR